MHEICFDITLYDTIGISTGRDVAYASANQVLVCRSGTILSLSRYISSVYSGCGNNVVVEEEGKEATWSGSERSYGYVIWRVIPYSIASR